MADDFTRLRNMVSRVILTLVWLQAPLASITAYAAGNAWLQPGAISLALASVVTLVWWGWPNTQSTRLIIGVALIASLSLIVGAGAGGTWQVDLHMCYFAELAMLAAYCDRDVVLAGAATTALHHLGLNFLMPALVFSGGAQLDRVVLHAVVLVVETAALAWLTQRIVTLFASSAANLEAAIHAAETTRAAEMQAADQRMLTEALRQQADAERASAAEGTMQGRRRSGRGARQPGPRRRFVPVARCVHGRIRGAAGQLQRGHGPDRGPRRRHRGQCGCDPIGYGGDPGGL